MSGVGIVTTDVLEAELTLLKNQLMEANHEGRAFMENYLAARMERLKKLRSRKETLREQIKREENAIRDLQEKKFSKWWHEVLSNLADKKLDQNLLLLMPEEVANFIGIEFGNRLREAESDLKSENENDIEGQKNNVRENHSDDTTASE